MSVAIAVADILSRVGYKCDIVIAPGNNTSDTDAFAMLEESLRRLSGNLSDYTDQGYFETTGTLATVANVPVISLPANFDKLVQLHWVKSDGTVEPLRMANLEEVRPSEADENWVTCVPVYRLRGNTVEFFPKPTTVERIEIRYTTGLSVTSSADTLNCSFGWDEWVVLDMACKIRQRNDKDYSSFAAERERIEREIRKQARRRDRVGFAVARDVRRDIETWDPYDLWRR